MIFLSHISYIRQNLMVNIILTTWTPTRPWYWFSNLNGNVSPFTTGSFCWWGMSMDESKVNVDSLYYFNPKEHHLRQIYRKLWTGQITLKLIPIYFLDEKTGHFFWGGDSLSFSPPFGRIPTPPGRVLALVRKQRWKAHLKTNATNNLMWFRNFLSINC